MSGIEPESIAYRAMALPLCYIDNLGRSARTRTEEVSACRADGVAAGPRSQNLVLPTGLEPAFSIYGIRLRRATRYGSIKPGAGLATGEESNLYS